MTRKLILLAALVLASTPLASAHRLDEYLQATLLTLHKDQVQASMRLIPGVSISAAVIAAIDTNHDGTLSPEEQRSYAEHVLGDLTLTANGQRLQPTLVSFTFPQPGEMREGTGEIHLDYTVALPKLGPTRALMLEDRHLPQASVYLVNVLAPTDRDLSVTAQKRNSQQSVYELDWTQANLPPAHWWTITNSVGFAGIFRLGMRHIAEGTDHLLFLLALLLPAPLLAQQGRWGAPAAVRPSIVRILKIVTAFTLGHSVTLALAAFGIVHVPGRPIEVLIAVSILVSAIHALRPVFPGREAWIAAFFGLIHGLAFATTLGELGLDRWQRVTGLLAFNLGIETMQMIVVALTLPSLLLLSRTRAYPAFRIPAALFAAFASLGWIIERTSTLTLPVDSIVNAAAHHAAAVAAALFFASLAASARAPHSLLGGAAKRSYL